MSSYGLTVPAVRTTRSVICKSTTGDKLRVKLELKVKWLWFMRHHCWERAAHNLTGIYIFPVVSYMVAEAKRVFVVADYKWKFIHSDKSCLETGDTTVCMYFCTSDLQELNRLNNLVGCDVSTLYRGCGKTSEYTAQAQGNKHSSTHVSTPWLWVCVWVCLSNRAPEKENCPCWSNPQRESTGRLLPPSNHQSVTAKPQQ